MPLEIQHIHPNNEKVLIRYDINHNKFWSVTDYCDDLVIVIDIKSKLQNFLIRGLYPT